ncbi:MAG: hypothetical protein QXM87_08885 [Candidatus Bathyarchaeia archaeon]
MSSCLLALTLSLELMLLEESIRKVGLLKSYLNQAGKWRRERIFRAGLMICRVNRIFRRPSLSI